MKQTGLDVDALKVVSDGVNQFRSKENSVILITHYQRLLDYIIPDFVHILVDGVIKKSGGPELALHVEKNGGRNYKCSIKKRSLLKKIKNMLMTIFKTIFQEQHFLKNFDSNFLLKMKLEIEQIR